MRGTMKRKTISLVLIVMITLSAGSLFAAGATEENDGTSQTPYGYGPGSMPGYGGPMGWANRQGNWDPTTQAALEQLKLEGAVKMQEYGPLLFEADGNTYILLYPYQLANGIDISDGETITIEGFLAPGPRWESYDTGDDAAPRALMVTTATIDGKEYVLPGAAAMAQGEYGYCAPGAGFGPAAGGRGFDNRGFGGRGSFRGGMMPGWGGSPRGGSPRGGTPGGRW